MSTYGVFPARSSCHGLALCVRERENDGTRGRVGIVYAVSELLATQARVHGRMLTGFVHWSACTCVFGVVGCICNLLGTTPSGYANQSPPVLCVYVCQRRAAAIFELAWAHTHNASHQIPGRDSCNAGCCRHQVRCRCCTDTQLSFTACRSMAFVQKCFLHSAAYGVFCVTVDALLWCVLGCAWLFTAPRLSLTRCTPAWQVRVCVCALCLHCVIHETPHISFFGAPTDTESKES